MKTQMVLLGLTSVEQRKEMLDAAHKTAQDMIDQAKTQGVKPAQLVLACCDFLLSHSPFSETEEGQQAILEMSAEAMIKIAKDKGFIDIKKVDESKPGDFFKSFMENILGHPVKVVVVSDEAPDSVEEPSCICGYDARNNERDFNVDCPVHSKTKNETIH